MSSDSTTFDLDTSETADGTVVRARGEIDIHACPVLDATLTELTGPRTVVLDLSGVGFIDSSGLRSILRFHGALADAGGRLVLRDPSPTARRLLDITGISDVLIVQ